FTNHVNDDPARVCWERCLLPPRELYACSLHPFLAEQKRECFLLTCACDPPCQRLQVRQAPLIDPHAIGLNREYEHSPLRIGHLHTYKRRHHLTLKCVVRPECSARFLREGDRREQLGGLLVVHLTSAGHSDHHRHLCCSA